MNRFIFAACAASALLILTWFALFFISMADTESLQYIGSVYASEGSSLSVSNGSLRVLAGEVQVTRPAFQWITAAVMAVAFVACYSGAVRSRRSASAGS